MSKIKIIECPRDAMQGIKTFIPTELKAKYINKLLKVGFASLDFGSFVSPKATPQMRDTAELLEMLDLENSKSDLLSVIASRGGAKRAIFFEQIKYLGFPLSISETFQYRNTRKTIAQSFESIEKIQNQSSKIHDLTSGKEDELVQSQKEVDDLVNQMLDYKSQLQKEQNKAKKLEEDLKEVKIKEDKIELSSSNEIVASSDDDELKRLIGDSYEVENDAIWYVEFDTGVKTGPHKFSVVYDMKESGKITKSTRVKKEGEGYKSCGDIFELATPVDTHGQGDDRRFFIKRNSVRVPYYDLVSFEMNGNEYKGYCTSISSGGIFIELTSIKENEYKVNSKGRVFFPRGAIENPFNCAAQIKNISKPWSFRNDSLLFLVNDSLFIFKKNQDQFNLVDAQFIDKPKDLKSPPKIIWDSKNSLFAQGWSWDFKNKKFFNYFE